MTQFSDGEKLILVMLADLYKALKVKGEIDPDVVTEAIFNNQMWSLRWEMTGIFAGDEPSDEMVRETADIMSMWREIEFAYERLDAADKARLEAAVPYTGKNPKFEGFDGNNDKQHGIANHLVNRMGRFEEFKGRSLNSHSSGSLPTYRNQLARKRRVEQSKEIGTRYDLTVDDLIVILKGDGGATP